MASLRFTEVPQPVIPNQRNDEVVFVLTRKHYIDYLPFAAIILALVIIPLGGLLIGLFPFIDFFRSTTVLIRDVIFLAAFAYYLIIIGIFITSWVSFYFYLFVVTDERVVEIVQKGLFSREMDILDFQQIEDISSITKGALNTFFNVGDIIIQTAGTAPYFQIKRVWRPQLAVEIIHSLTHQAKDGIEPSKRIPDLETIGLINGKYLTRESRVLPIMNLEKNLKQKVKSYKSVVSTAKTLREKLDRWWWSHNDQMVATFGPSVTDEDRIEDDYSPTINETFLNNNNHTQHADASEKTPGHEYDDEGLKPIPEEPEDKN